MSGVFELPTLETDANGLKSRLTARLDRGEYFGLIATIIVTIVFAWQHLNHIFPYHYDLGNYLKTANNDFSTFFYAYWFLPIFSLLARWPFPVVFAFWNFLNIAGTFLASRVFGGKALWTLLSYQMIYTLFQGNIAGILAGTLALTWICMVNKQWLGGGLFLLLACTKYQIGIPFGLLLICYAPGNWRQKMRLFVLPAAITLVSFGIWGFWPWKVLATIQHNPPDAQGNITLWAWTGVFALLVWIPPFLKNIPTPNHLTMLLCAIVLGQPYLQQSDLIVLFSFLPNPVAVMGNIGYVLAAIKFDMLRCMVFLPLGIYLWAWISAYRPVLSASDAE